MREFILRYFSFIIIFLLVLVAVLFGFFLRNDISYKNPGLIAESQVGVWTERVGRLAVLPLGEIPDIAEVSNPEALKNQIFFAEAKRGDIVLIYPNAKKAILYDPKADKIITMATVNIGDALKSNQMLPNLPKKGQFNTINEEGESQF